MRSSFVAATLCFALVTSFGPIAFADEPPPEAKRAFADGKTAYDQGDYDTALRDFQRAQLIAPAPSLHYNVGMAYERLGRYAEAASSFDKYLAQIGTPRTDDERAAQAKVKERADADRSHAQGSASAPPPAYTAPPVAPQPPPQGYPPYYYYAPYGQPMMAPGMPVLSRNERIRRAKRQRLTGIVLLSIGGGFLVAGSAMAGVAANTDYGNHASLYLGTAIGGTFAILGGIALAIPGAILLAKGQKAINAEKHTPDDSAATRRAALDVAAPGVRFARPTLAFALPPIRF